MPLLRTGSETGRSEDEVKAPPTSRMVEKKNFRLFFWLFIWFLDTFICTIRMFCLSLNFVNQMIMSIFRDHKIGIDAVLILTNQKVFAEVLYSERLSKIDSDYFKQNYECIYQ